MLLIERVAGVERVVSRRLSWIRRIDHAQILQPAGSLDVWQQPLQKLLIAFAVEDNHRHGPVAEAPPEVLSDDVFKKGGLACACSARNDAMLDADRIRPKPGFFVDVVAENSGIGAVRILNDGCVSATCNRQRGVGPHFLPLLAPANEVRKNQSYSKEADREIEKDFQALGASEMETR